ncbi:MAG TPA: sugar ABC transporter permease [Rectinemataceae bacterium]|nr:sugar ABC transporter permease [Rectinemataceae bacterium]
MSTRDRRKRDPVNIFALPAVVIVALVTQVPLIVTLILSAIKWIIVRPDLGIRFIGLENYLSVFKDAEFYMVIVNTIVLTVVSLAGCTVLGLALALLLNRKFVGINIARTLMIAPFFVMDAVVGIVWKTLMLHPSFGINGMIAGWLHIKPIDFLGSHSLATIIMLVIWQWTPFFVLVLLSGFESISEEILDSAKVDGAGIWRTIFQIKIPAIASHIEVAVMLGLIFILKVFGIIYVTTSGGPGISSTNLPYLVYRTGFFRWDVGRATAMAVITVILTLVAVTAFFRFTRRKTSEVES